MQFDYTQTVGDLREATAAMMPQVQRESAALNVAVWLLAFAGLVFDAIPQPF